MPPALKRQQRIVLEQLFELTGLLGDAMQGELSGHALTPARAEVVWCLHHRGPLTQRQLSEELRCTPRNVTGLVDALELDHSEAQILIWALKEAALKALRTGFRLSPKKLKLSIDLENCSARVRTRNAGHWQVCFRKHHEYYLAVAYPERGIIM
jgi:hypothetical protein